MTAKQLSSIRRHLAAIYAVIDSISTEKIVDKKIAKHIEGRKLGDRIKFAYRSLGISQRELADRICMNTAQLNRIVSGRNDPSVSTLRRIADALGVPPSALI